MHFRKVNGFCHFVSNNTLVFTFCPFDFAKLQLFVLKRNI